MVERKAKKVGRSGGYKIVKKGIVINPKIPYLVANDFHKWKPFIFRKDGVFREYDGTCYPILKNDELDKEIYRFADYCVQYDKKGRSVPVVFNKNQVVNIKHALVRYKLLKSKIEPPVWLPGYKAAFNPKEILSFKNCLLHIPSGKMLDHTPGFYCHYSLDYPYNPKNRKIKEWRKFLKCQWDTEGEEVQALQEIFGYILFGDTSLQKMFLLLGPRRAGKGIIMRTLRRLLGKHNVIGPSLKSLSRAFGLSGLIDKPLATVTEARPGKDIQEGIERLLAISGEDAVSIDRKYREETTLELPTRFLFATNVLPNLRDTSRALASRFIILELKNSFLGKEDYEIEKRVTTELPGILNWSLEGYKRLLERQRFIQPKSSEHLLNEMEDIGSPVGAFVRERCKVASTPEQLKDPKFYTRCDRLHSEYIGWRISQGYDDRVRGGTNIAIFGRDLKAVNSVIERKRITVKKRKTVERIYVYRAIRLRKRH